MKSAVSGPARLFSKAEQKMVTIGDFFATGLNFIKLRHG